MEVKREPNLHPAGGGRVDGAETHHRGRGHPGVRRDQDTVAAAIPERGQGETETTQEATRTPEIRAAARQGHPGPALGTEVRAIAHTHGTRGGRRNGRVTRVRATRSLLEGHMARTMQGG